MISVDNPTAGLISHGTDDPVNRFLTSRRLSAPSSFPRTVSPAPIARVAALRILLKYGEPEVLLGSFVLLGTSFSLLLV